MSFKPFTPPLRQTPRTSRPVVLYVEDEDTNWELAERELRDRYEMRRARDALEAFHEISRGGVEVVLMDIQLSGSDLNGIEIVQILRGKYAGVAPTYTHKITLDVPIIFVTAYGARYSKEELIAAGGNDLATKPVNLAALALLLARVSGQVA